MDNDSKFRMTQQRIVILEMLRQTKSHPTAEDIYIRVRTKLPHISLGTVYRNLDFLCELGLVECPDLGGTQRRYEYKGTPHYHIRCIKCGLMEDIELTPIYDKINDLVVTLEFKIIGHTLEFIGYCPKCQAKDPSGGKKKSRK